MLSLLALLPAGCGGSGRSEAVPVEMQTTAVAGAAAVSARDPAPAVEGTTLDGDRISLKSLRGRPIFVNVWSSW
jgi:hypothetical protein